MAHSDRMLTAEDIWAAHDIREDEVYVPEWGGSVRVRALSLKQISAVAIAAVRRNLRTGQDETDREMLMLMTLVEGVVEPKLTMADGDRLMEKSATAVTRIVQAINALGPTEDAVNGAAKSDAPQLNDALSIHTRARAGHDEESTA